jgi:cytosine/adenosine deaminase-related metal-dependent hydrolase
MNDVSQSNELVIKAGAALLPDGDRQAVVRDVSIRVVGDRIEQIVQGEISTIAPQLDLPEQLLLPGFISSHCHVAAGVPTRAIIEPRGGNYSLAMKVADELDDDDMDAMTAFNLAELIRTGCTTQVEMSLSLHQAKSYVRVAEEFGARGYPSGMIPGYARLFDLWRTAHGPLKVMDDGMFEEYIPGTMAEIEENLAFGREWNHACDDRIRTMMGPHAPDTHTPETMLAILAAAKELGNGLHIHLAQSVDESLAVHRRWGLRSVEWLDSLGLFDVPVFGAHMRGANLLHDPTILANRPFVFANCPFDIGASGNLPPYPEMLAAGVAVGVGVDGHNMDFIDTLKMAVVKGQARYQAVSNPGVRSQSPTIEDAVLGATKLTADNLGRPDLGRLDVGAKADLITIDVTGMLVGSGRISPAPLSNLLYANGLHVRNVVIDGHWKVRDGELLFADVEQLTERAGRAVQKVWDRLKEAGWLDTLVPDLPRFPLHHRH